MSDRFSDNNESVYAFMDKTYVECPQCGSCAVSARVNEADSDWFAERRLSCKSCGHSDHWHSRKIHRRWREVRDDYFGLPLWLQTECRGEVLWAYNEQHLELLERLVSARQRERTPDEDYGWANRSLLSRLPKWIKAKKNRDDVLKGISRLRSNRLGEAF